MPMVKRRQAIGYGVLTARGSILCVDGEYRKPIFVGPGGYSAKIWKTKAGAERTANRIHGSVFFNGSRADYTLSRKR